MVGRAEKHYSAGHLGLQDSVVQSLASASGDEWGEGELLQRGFSGGQPTSLPLCGWAQDASKGHTEDQVSQVWPLSLLALGGHCAAQRGSFFLIYSQLLIRSAVFDSGLISGVVQDVRNSSTFFFSFGTGYPHFPIPSDAHEGVYPRLNGYASKRAWFKNIYTSPGTIAPPDLIACPHTPISLKSWAMAVATKPLTSTGSLGHPVMLFHLRCCEFSGSFMCFADWELPMVQSFLQWRVTSARLTHKTRSELRSAQKDELLV